LGNYYEKKAIITGITGQDGFYLAKLLLEKEYEVHGCLQPLAHNDTSYLEPFLNQLHLHYCDLCDGGAVFRLLAEVRPDEIYNLGAQTHVGISFEVPEYTTNVNGLGTLRLLEAMRALKLEKTTRFYQASTSEIFGDTRPPQNELSAFHPRSPYAAAKLYAYHIVQNYRDAYGIHASNGILFNHESPKRGHDFVTRKVTRAVAAISAGKQEYVELGNMNAMRDWGHAVDYVEGQWLMLQKDIPDDYVLATGRKKSVRDLCNEAFQCIGITLEW
jgi:GDPmannose 4,6-dehydratase